MSTQFASAFQFQNLENKTAYFFKQGPSLGELHDKHVLCDIVV